MLKLHQFVRSYWQALKEGAFLAVPLSMRDEVLSAFLTQPSEQRRRRPA